MTAEGDRVAKYYEVVVFPGDSKKSKIRRFKIPKFLIWLILLLVPSFLAFSGYIIYNYGSHEMKCEKIFKTAHIYRMQVKILEKKVKKIQAQVSKVRELDEKLRVIANLKPAYQESENLWGVGGIPEDLSSSGEMVNTLSPEESEQIRQLHYDLFRLERVSKFEQKSLKELHDKLISRRDLLDSTPSIRPAYGFETSGFGYRISPFTGHKHFHEGLDIANRKGTPVIAPANGLVVFTGRKGGFGNLIIIDHGHGVTTRYGHLAKIFVKVGQRVKRGEKIAEIGNTGRSTGPHLHYEVRLNGVPVNPRRYILN